MAPVKATLAVAAVLISLFDETNSFFAPVHVGRSRAARPAGMKALTNGFEAREQQLRIYDAPRKQASMSAATGKSSSSGISAKESGAAVRPPSRLSRISGRVRRLIRKAVMGYDPEEEVSYNQRVAQQAAAAAELRGEQQIADERLRGASNAAKAAAIEVVQQSVLAVDDEEDEDDILNSGFVQLNIGNQSPMEAEDRLASLRRRLEQGLPPDTAQEQAEKRRMAAQKQQQLRLRQQEDQRPPRPPSFDGDTAVAERPSPTLGARRDQGGKTDQGATRSRSKEAPKLASAEDIERLNRMFGSMGGEPLR